MNLGEDVVSQILLRLPVQSLLRFRCVSKEWCTLINSCVFRDTYLALRCAMAVDDQLVGLKTTIVSDIPYEDMNRVLDLDDELRTTLQNDLSRGIYSISVTGWSGDYQSLASSALAPSSSSNDFEISGNYSGEIGIINHVHGLVCIVHGNNWFDITLVNPALREIRKLPTPIFDLGGFKRRRLAIGIGFGYDDDSSNKDYKVVAIVTDYEEEDCFNGVMGDPYYISPHYKHILIVYHLSTNSWTVLGYMSRFVSSPFVSFANRESVFFNGSLHWCMQLTIDPETRYQILAFDVTNESFREIPFPHSYTYCSPYDRAATVPRLFNIDKSTIALVASSTNLDWHPQVLEVWMMKEYGRGGDSDDSWTKAYSISGLPGFIRAISFWKKYKLLLVSIGGELMCYDLLKGQLDEHEQDYPFGISWIRGFHLVSGHQSFVSVKLQV